MASVTNSLAGLSYLTQPGGLLSNLPAPISAATLQSATPQDLVSLSAAALETQEVDGLFGLAPSASAVALPVLSTPSAEVLPGVATADLSGASPQAQAAINDQALLLQQVQGLFSEPGNLTGMLDLTA
jgi:hypothetical protein